MPKLLIISLVTIFFGLNSSRAGLEKIISKPGDTSCWINSFREFRNAVADQDMEKVKHFMNFPVMNTRNEIWDLVYGNDEKLISHLPDTIKPFTENDYNTWHNRIFTKWFIYSILKINLQTLYEAGEAQSPEFKDHTYTYKMYASWDKEDQSLILNLAMKTAVRKEDGGMFNVIYEFIILNKNTLRFRQVKLAG